MTMTRKEIYKELEADGAKLKTLRTYNLSQLQELYTERFGHAPDEKPAESDEAGDAGEVEENHTDDADDAGDTQDESPDDAESDEAGDAPKVQEIHTLEFDRSGWCEELKQSYFKGIHRPATVKEYLTLRKYAAKEI